MARWSPNATTVAGSALGSPGYDSSSLDYNGGIRIVDNETLYIADTYNNRIVLIRSNSTTAVSIIGSLGNASHQFNQPTDVFVTNTSIYILDASNYRVQKWSRNGSNGTTVAGITGVSGSTASNNTFAYSYGIQVDIFAFLYVSDRENHRVLRFPPGSTSGTSGVVVAGSSTGTAGSGPSDLSYPFSIFIDEVRSIYVADTGNHRIQRWAYGACSGVTVAGTGTAGGTTSQLDNPVSVIVDSSQVMYIGDQSNNRIHRWVVGDCEGRCLVGCTQTNGIEANQLSSLQALDLDGQGALYVSDGGNNRVQKFSLLKDFGE